MTPYEAKEILAFFCEISDEYIESISGHPCPFVFVNGDGGVNLDGEFTADQLEAITIWMRDKRAVLSATRGGYE